jgi:hypothetical protein
VSDHKRPALEAARCCDEIYDEGNQSRISRIIEVTDFARYSQEKLSQSARSHIRRSLNEFEIRFVTPAEILKVGRKAYCDGHSTSV